MTNPATGPRFRLAPGVALGGGRRPPIPPHDDVPAPDDVPAHDDAHARDDAPARDAASATDTDQPSPPERPTEPPQQLDGFRNTRWDRAALAVSIDPVWLLAPLFVRDTAGLDPDGELPGPLAPPVACLDMRGADLAAASSDWRGWWNAALNYRPGTPAPRVDDLISGSPPLQQLWARLAEQFRNWLASRPAPTPGDDMPARNVERQALADFAATNDRAPGRWTVRILEIPVTGSYLSAPESRRIVVSAALRADPAAYAAALTAALPDHF